MGFEVFQKSSAPVSKVPTVTIQRRGLISMNRAAHGLIGAPDFVELLYEGERKIVGIRATTEDNPNAYPARPQSTANNKGPIMVAGTVFTRFYDIPTEESRRWVVYVEDDILCVDLMKESQRVTSNRSGRNAESATAAS